MRVLVTGSEGYIGTVLAPYLMDRGHDVVGLDAGFHRIGWLYGRRRSLAPMAESRRPDADRRRPARLRRGRPPGRAVQRSARGARPDHHRRDQPSRQRPRRDGRAKAAGVERFIQMSSCSVYGTSAGGFSDETAALEPLTDYARCKVLVERDVAAMADDGFSPTFLRNATAFGASPRQRFDLVVNDLAGHAWTEKVIRMDSDGSPWRPFVHILDISQAIDRVLQAPRDVDPPRDLQRRQQRPELPDPRYRRDHRRGLPGLLAVHRRQLRRLPQLPGELRQDPRATAGLRAALGRARRRRAAARASSSRSTCRARRSSRAAHTRIKQIQHLLATGQVDRHLFWIDPFAEGSTTATTPAAVAGD